jgi:hypothetical protein
MGIVKQLTPEIVREIWYRRAEGDKNLDIANDLGMPEWLASGVITQDSGPEIVIPDNIRQAALRTVQCKKRHTRKTNGAAKPQRPNPNAIHDFIDAQTALAEAVKAVDIHWREARDSGVSEPVLKGIRDAIYEQYSFNVVYEVKE